MIVGAATAPRDGADDGGLMVYLSSGGGLTQFGAYVDRLTPGGVSSERHWHSAEDEFVYVLSGVATVVDDDGAHVIGPGDAACWPHGCENAHHLINRSDAPVTYLIVGSRVALDICTYPDSGQRQINHATTWEVVDGGGARLRGGDLPPHLLNLPGVWGQPFDAANPTPRVLSAAKASLPVWVEADDVPHPVLGAGPGPYAYQLLSDPGGLTQFGAFLETLPPGSQSGHRHWHEGEDEMVYILSGEVVLVEDTENTLRPGDCACWPAGHAVGHRLDNRSGAPASYLVIGTRAMTDIIHYSEHDLITHKDGTARRYLRADGTEYRRKT